MANAQIARPPVVAANIPNSRSTEHVIQRLTDQATGQRHLVGIVGQRFGALQRGAGRFQRTAMTSSSPSTVSARRSAVGSR